ncbi:hypothetical protein T459_31325 [Capsicum annuum]|uniref:Uncharacterized protein n=1 Tax=Capsicum annuum TaxID=4072 RepID=A0A2G2YB04_CAPAN|nr:hypothetical protein T459_31325 [Capsicum annuum]
MRGTRRGRSGRRGVVGTSLDTGQSSNPSEGPLQTQKMQRGPIQKTSLETQSSRNLDESVCLSLEDETGADYIDRAVGSGARDIVNYCGWIKGTTVSFRDGSWQNIVLKHGEAMWYRVKVVFLDVDFSGCVVECDRADQTVF